MNGGKAMEPSLREAIKWAEEGMNILNLYTQNELTHLRVIVAAAGEWADHIDNEDPEGMRDRNCGTCKYEDLWLMDNPCRECSGAKWDVEGSWNKWEPK